MSQTLIATFDNLTEANRAVERLVGLGFQRSAIDVKTTGASSPDDAVSAYGDGSVRETTSSSASAPAAREEEGVLESLGRFFSDLFGGADQREYAGHYSEAVRRGKAVLALRLDDESRVDEANNCLLTAGALDIDEQVQSWRSEGYQPSSFGTAATAGANATANALSPAAAAGSSSNAGAASVAASGREDVIPVVQEELEVGKRVVDQGRVRVVSRVVSQPVRETVELRSEKAVVERRPVDRPASDADLSGLQEQERTIEVRESAEKAVVNKTAHVVEEVVVGKQVSTETQQIKDSVRRTEVEVERDNAAFDAQRERFRSDYQANYASSGQSFDAYEPAYRSGFALRNDERYRGKNWEEVEPTAREQWEASNPDTWERMRDAHRRGWDWERS